MNISKNSCYQTTYFPTNPNAVGMADIVTREFIPGELKISYTHQNFSLAYDNISFKGKKLILSYQIKTLYRESFYDLKPVLLF